MDSEDIGKPTLLDRFKGRFSNWDMRKIARVVLYTGGVVFVIVLVISAGRTPQSQTATTVTQAPAAFTIDKWYDYAGSPTAKSGAAVTVHLRIRNPGEPQMASVKDFFPPGFAFVNNSINCVNLTCNNPNVGANWREWVFGDSNKIPVRSDNSEITYQLTTP